jgi:hypothetical protein
VSCQSSLHLDSVAVFGEDQEAKEEKRRDQEEDRRRSIFTKTLGAQHGRGYAAIFGG